MLLVERDKELAILTLKRPEKRNALNAALRAEIAGRFAELDADDSIKVVVLTGAPGVLRRQRPGGFPSRILEPIAVRSGGLRLLILGIAVAVSVGFAVPAAGSCVQTWTKTREDQFAGPFVLTRSQGVTHDVSGWVFSWQGGLERTDEAYTTQSLATWPYDNFSDAYINPDGTNRFGGSHIGDVDNHNGLIYAPIEDGEENLELVTINNPEYQQAHIALYDARTLLYTGVSYPVPHELQRDGVPWIAIDHTAGEAYTGEWGMQRDELNVWTLDMILERTLPLHYPASLGTGFHLSRIQGGEVLDGSLYAARDDAAHTIYKIDLATGDVSSVFALGGAEPSELEGMAVYPDADGSLIHVILITDNDFGDPTNFAKVRASFQHFAPSCV